MSKLIKDSTKTKQLKILQLHESVFQSGETIDTVNGRELHCFLESKKDFTDWIKAKIKKYSFVEGEDYMVLLPQKKGQKGSGGHNKTDYFLSLDMAKELSMVEANLKGKEARQYFIRCEKELKAQLKKQVSQSWKQFRLEGKEARLTLTDAIQRYEQYADKQGGIKTDKDGNETPEKRYYYSKLTGEIYFQLFCDRKLKKIRDNKLDYVQLQLLGVCEAALSVELNMLVDLGTEYHEIYQLCKQRIGEIVKALSQTKLNSQSASQIKLAWEIQEPHQTYKAQHLPV